MSSIDRARRVVKHLMDTPKRSTLIVTYEVILEALVGTAIGQAVAEEREACAKIAEGTYDLTGGSTGNARGTAQAIATIIRKRGERCPESSPTPA